MDDLSIRMRAAVAEPPPTRIDLDRLIAGERRRSRTTTWTAAGTAMAAAVAAIAIAPALLAGSGPRGVAAPPAAPASGTPVPATASPKLCAPLKPIPTGPQPPLQSHDTVRARPTEPMEQAVPRLTVGLSTALAAVLPPGMRVEALEEGCTEPQFQFHPSYREYEVSARIVAGQGSGFLLVRVMPTPANDDKVCQASGDPTDCARTTFPDGTVALADTMDAGTGGERQVSVVAHRPDGTSVFLIANNYSLGAGPEATEPTLTSANPPLTAEQLIEIGRDPGLTLYP